VDRPKWTTLREREGEIVCVCEREIVCLWRVRHSVSLHASSKMRRACAALARLDWQYTTNLSLPATVASRGQVFNSGQLWSKYGKHDTVKARFWPWHSGKIPSKSFRCCLFARKRRAPSPPVCSVGLSMAQRARSYMQRESYLKKSGNEV